MSLNLIVSVRSQPNNHQRITLQNFNLHSKVDEVKEEVAKSLNTPKENFELSYCGLILESNSSLEASNIKCGVTLHFLQKKSVATPTEPPTFSHFDLQQVVSAFQAFRISAPCRNALHRLSKPEVIENIIAATPGLVEDPIALAFLHDVELLTHMCEISIVQTIAKTHPFLIEAVQHVVAFIQEEAVNPRNSQGTAPEYPFSLDIISDDDDDDIDTLNEPQPQHVHRNPSFNAVTRAQLAAAIANATSTAGISTPLRSRPTTATAGTNTVITSDMLNTAMQQAVAQNLNSRVGLGSANMDFPIPSAINVNDTIETLMTQLRPQLQQMQEMGLINESLNIRALQATMGDVQAAIELVLSGVLD